jgi:hypothetical protein
MTAKDFFMTELPPLIAEWKARLGERVPKASYDVEFEIEGEGMFTVVVKNGDATVRRGGSATPLASMTFAKATWNDALENVIRPRLKQLAGLDLTAAEAHAQRELHRYTGGRTPVAPEKAIAAIAKTPLRVVLDLEPKGDHKYELRTAGAEEDDPTLTVGVREDDLRALLAGELNPQQAMQQGKIRIKGAMSDGMALISRLFV